MESTAPVLTVTDLCRNFRDKEAVAGVSISVERGEILGLLGPNGAGKTTTIRLLITHTLLHDPPVLFLDELTRGLDPIAAREVPSAIAQLSQPGKTILLTMHWLDEACELCRRVAFIVDGRIVAKDTPRNLKLSHRKRS